MSIAVRATVITPSGQNSAYGQRVITPHGGATRSSQIVGSGVSLFYQAVQTLLRIGVRNEALSHIRPVESEVRRRIQAAGDVCIFVVVKYTTQQNRYADPMGNVFARLVGAEIVGEGVFPQSIVDDVESRGFIYPGGNVVFSRHYVAYSHASVMMTG